jgi:LPXTG-site transpeptidase (sortase) family protein
MSESKPLETTVYPGKPVRLTIPKLGVDAAINPLGLTAQGDMAAPADPDSAGWLASGTRPGRVGSAVINGHFGWKNDLPAIFDNLHTLQAGDTFTVEDEKHAVFSFVVRELRTYTPDQDATAVFQTADGKAHLNLITCQGTWNNAQKSYSERLVVFADQVEVTPGKSSN